MLVFAVEFFGSLLLDKYRGGYTEAIMTGRMIVCLVLRRDVCSHRSFQEDITMKFVKKMLATLVACAMAMTLLTACGGAGNGKGNPMLDAVNEILKGNGSEIVLEHSPELNKAVEEVAALEEQKDAGEITGMEYAQKMAALTDKYGVDLTVIKSYLTTEAACAAEVAQEILESGKELNEAAYGTVSLKGGNYVLVICR
jgi:hypothetical protein